MQEAGLLLYYIGFFIVLLFLTKAVWLAFKTPKRIDELEKRLKKLENKENK